MSYRLTAAFIFALSAQSVWAEDLLAPALLPAAPETAPEAGPDSAPAAPRAAPPEAEAPDEILGETMGETSGQTSMQANEIERLLNGPTNNTSALNAISSATQPDPRIAQGVKSVTTNAIMPSVTAAGTTAATGAIAAVAAPVLILGGIAAIGATAVCAELCDQPPK